MQVKLERVFIYMKEGKLVVEAKIRRLSLRQLKALAFLCQNEKGLGSSTAAGERIGVKGKSLGGVFSSLSRQKIKGEPLILPFGRSEDGRGLRWRLNTKLISIKDLKALVGELLAV